MAWNPNIQRHTPLISIHHSATDGLRIPKWRRYPSLLYPSALFLMFDQTSSSHTVIKSLKHDVKALNEIKSSLRWRVVYEWVGDDPYGDGSLPRWSGVTCSTVGDYRVVTELSIFTDAEEDDRADLRGIRDQKIASQKEKKVQNWFPRQFVRKMSEEYDSLEMEHVTAIAAAAFAIASPYLSEQKPNNEGPESLLTKTKSKVGDLSRKLTGSFKSSDGPFTKTPIFPVTDEKKPEKTLTPVSSMKKASTSSDPFNRDDTEPDSNLKKREDIKPAMPEPKLAAPIRSASSRLMPPPPPPPTTPPRPLHPQLRPPQVRNNSIKPGPPRPPTPPIRMNTNERKAAAWEREQLEAIKNKYEKLKETIDAFETKKKAKARRKLEKKEMSSSEKERRKAYEKFQTDMEYYNGIVRAASVEAEERRKNEEHKVREKAQVIRTTGKLPGTCPCF